MEISKEISNVPFADLQKLEAIESELTASIKSLLNERYRNIKITPRMVLRPWYKTSIVVDTECVNGVDNSENFLADFNAFLSSKNSFSDILCNKYTLYIKLRLSPRSDMNKSDKPAATDAQESTVSFFSQEPRYNFDQIILDESVRREIFNALKIIANRDLIYNKWGFSDVDPVPRCILNFYGDPGTGKTMCAHAIAHHFGKKILALNYAEIESKYVGEAPKNLQKAFDTAKDDDAILFFDEADSFLGKRVENVSQGADQALNSLRSQMLILLEEFPGIVLFATNLVTNFDRAFESRILKHIKFQLPNLEARAAIIKRMIPPRLPLASPFTDDDYLSASKLIEGFSGREIKNAILDMLLSKATTEDKGIVFCFDDLCQILKKRQQEKKQLKEEEDNRLKNKIMAKLKEKEAEKEALKESENQNNGNQPEETLNENNTIEVSQ